MRFSPEPGSRSEYAEAFVVPSYRAVQSHVVLELRRARRYEHPLSVLTLSLQAPPRPPQPGVAALPSELVAVTPAVYGLLGAFLRNTLRETDILTGMPESLAFAAFLPGVDRQGAEQALERFRHGFLECAGFDLRAGVAAFPEDGLTIEDLLGRAGEAWRKAPRPQANIALTPNSRYSHG